jgi:L-threonylcarbamoyladenylate synthase
LRATLLAMGSDSFAIAAREVRRGGLVVYPTDTVYGLGCDPLNQAAVKRLFEAKGRERKPVPVLCSSLEEAEKLVKFSPRASELAARHWPGPLTIVAPLARTVPPQLTQGGKNLGVRVPAHPGALELIVLCGGRLTGTSANLSGRPSARSAADAIDQLGNAVEVVLDGGRLSGTESTVVQVEGEEVTLLRAGPIGVGPR